MAPQWIIYCFGKLFLLFGSHISVHGSITVQSTTIAFMNNSVGNVVLQIVLINPLNITVEANISSHQDVGFMRNLEINPNNYTVVNLITDTFGILGIGKSFQGILVQSRYDLTIIGLTAAYNSGDMYFANPSGSLGTEYVVITHCEKPYHCQFAVVSMKTSLIIQVTLPTYFQSSITLADTSYGPGDNMTILLNQFEIFQLQSTSDLSGVRLSSCKEIPFSAFSGGTCTKVLQRNGRDHLADTVPPVNLWGTQYLLTWKTDFYDSTLVKFIAAAGGATISVDGCGNVNNYSLSGYETYALQIMCKQIHIHSKVPFLAAHFPTRSQKGDAAMYYLVPIVHYAHTYSIFIPEGYPDCAIGMMAETAKTSTIQITNHQPDFNKTWSNIGNTIYSATWVTGLSHGLKHIFQTSASPFSGVLICMDTWTTIATPFGRGNYSSDRVHSSITSDIPTCSSTYEPSSTKEDRSGHISPATATSIKYTPNNEVTLASASEVQLTYSNEDSEVFSSIDSSKGIRKPIVNTVSAIPDSYAYHTRAKEHITSQGLQTTRSDQYFSKSEVTMLYASELSLTSSFENSETFSSFSTVSSTDSSTTVSSIPNMKADQTSMREIITAHVFPSTSGHQYMSQTDNIMSFTRDAQLTSLHRDSEVFLSVVPTTVSSTTAATITVSSTQNTNASMQNCLCCSISWGSMNDSVNSEYRSKLIDELKKDMLINKMNTSSYIRKRTSAWDSRPSSTGIGIVGVIILVAVTGSIIAIDCSSTVRTRYIAIRNCRHTQNHE